MKPLDKSDYGKGSKVRPHDKIKWDQNWEDIFGKKTKPKKPKRSGTKKPKDKN